MAKYKLEYIWLDGYQPVPNLRGKTQVKEFANFPKLEELPFWGFDGSSTRQAEGRNSDCMLKPVAVYPDATKTNGALVMCEVMMPDCKTPHPSNARATILDDPGAWFGYGAALYAQQSSASLDALDHYVWLCNRGGHCEKKDLDWLNTVVRHWGVWGNWPRIIFRWHLMGLLL